MGVYIRGMEMPTNCDSCPCYYETEGAWRNECEVLGREHYLTEERPSWCPLVPVPPHGRLIDADAAAEKIWEDMRFPSNLANAQFFANELREMPTIIEAEEGE